MSNKNVLNYIKEVTGNGPIDHPGNSDKEALKFNRPKDIDDIGTFWVVTRPTGQSELIDILFKSSVKGMMIQAGGGLSTTDTIAITPDYEKALAYATQVLERQGVSGEIEDEFRSEEN